jgi:hypothetical protein
MSRSPSGSDTAPIDPADRARLFTVQLRDDAAALSGRLTHVATGETAHFDSGDELVALIARVGRPPSR